jgi:hypothetical protein
MQGVFSNEYGWCNNRSHQIETDKARVPSPTSYTSNIVLYQLILSRPDESIRELGRSLVLEDDQNSSAVILASPLANSFLHEAAHCERG